MPHTVLEYTADEIKKLLIEDAERRNGHKAVGDVVINMTMGHHDPMERDAATPILQSVRVTLGNEPIKKPQVYRGSAPSAAQMADQPPDSDRRGG